MLVSLNLQCALSTKVLPVSNIPRLVYLLLTISGGEGAETLPSNISLIIDTSDSMRIRLVSDNQFSDLVMKGLVQEVMTDGIPAYQISSIPEDQMVRFPRRIDFVSQALNTMSEYLRPQDYFSLIAFAGWAHCIIPSISGRERARLLQVARELEYLRLGEGTNMSEGIALAYEELQRQAGKSSSGRMILLTDGHTLKVSECYEWAKKAHEHGFILTTMGIGAEFNEDLLIPLADQTSGNAYYIETPNQIPDALSKELGAAMHISYHNVEVKVLISSDVKLRKVHRVLPELGDFDHGPNLGGEKPLSSSYSLLIGDYDPGVPVGLLLELIVPPWPSGNHRLAQALLTWENPSAEVGLLNNAHSGLPARENLRQEIDVQFAKMETARLDEYVMNIVEKVGAFRMGTLALEAAQTAVKNKSNEEKSSATVRLRQAATQLLDLGEQSLADSMLSQADALEQSGVISPEATKKLRYETRRLSQH